MFDGLAPQYEILLTQCVAKVLQHSHNNCSADMQKGGRLKKPNLVTLYYYTPGVTLSPGGQGHVAIILGKLYSDIKMLWFKGYFYAPHVSLKWDPPFPLSIAHIAGPPVQ